MQWLIDLVIEAIGIPPTFIDRGDPVNVDFTWIDHLFFPANIDLDLTAIVPEGASAVLINMLCKNAAIDRFIQLRTKGNTNITNVSKITTQVALLDNGTDMTIPLSSNRTVEMLITGTWVLIEITVKGWWL